MFLPLPYGERISLVGSNPLWIFGPKSMKIESKLFTGKYTKSHGFDTLLSTGLLCAAVDAAVATHV